MLLFTCHTLLQLVNSINIKINYYPNEPADIVLTKQTDFSCCVEALCNTGIFDEVIHLDWTQQDWTLEKNEAENTKIMQNAKNHKFALKNGKKYDHIFTCVLSDSLGFLFYYQMLEEGIKPTVHLYEDGPLPYWGDYIRDGNIDHNVFPKESRILNNIAESLLYEPSLFTNPKEKVSHTQMPKSPEQLERLTPYLYELFGKPELPKEKYIYFDEAFSFDGSNNNDCDLLDFFAAIVGKENIIVKIHPRSSANNTYSMRGYKTFITKDIPWEVFLTLEGIDDKVLIAISSNAAVAPFMMFGKKTKSILLYKISLNLRHLMACNAAAAFEFFNRIYSNINSDEKQLFIPKTMCELECCIKYIEGEV